MRGRPPAGKQYHPTSTVGRSRPASRWPGHERPACRAAHGCWGARGGLRGLRPAPAGGGYAKWAYSRLYSWEDAREAANEALFRLYLRWPDAWSHTNTEAFAHKILRNVVADILRKRDRRPCFAAGLAFEETTRPILGMPHEEVEQLAMRMEIYQAVAQLPGRQRTCIFLHHLLGCPVREIADITGLTCSTIRSHLAAGKAALAGLLNIQADEPPAAEKGL
ncbi:RNA polymerase sigma factor [Streptomyces triculaminicus]|uniref:RNA polymerase sigma factor n=1 Tax=Streptomyces triculaminicus TaxID=2816232 RepID=UPI00378EA718